ncbi:MAG: response regulator [Candidatus Nanoarchaeia archaeon]
MKKTILVVDDSKDVRKFVKEALLSENFNVITAEDGEDCFRKLKNNNVDLILLDIVMPGLTTEEILSEFKRQKLQIPVILFSITRSWEMVEKAKKVGYKINDYIEKPFSSDNLLKKIKAVFETKP